MLFILFRSSHRRCSAKKGVLSKFANFIGKHLCWSLFEIKMQASGKLQHRSFPVKFAKCLRTPILKNICKQLLPYLHNNSHCHYHHHHFHYHCKMHLYHLSILLPIPLDCNIIPSVSAKFLSSVIYFYLVLFQAFRFLCPVKELRIRLWPADQFLMFSLYLYFVPLILKTPKST